MKLNVFFDVVLDNDYATLFNGITADTVTWLQQHPEHRDKWVCEGRSLKQYSVTEYLRVFGKANR